MQHSALCVLHQIFGAQSEYAFALPADFEFPKVYRTAGGVTSQEGQLVNSRPPEIAIYLHTYLHSHAGAEMNK